MGFTDWLRGKAADFALNTKASATQVLFTPEGTVRWPIKSRDNFAREAYIKNVVSFRCITEIAQAVSSVPWDVYALQDDGRELEVDDHWIKGLLRHPNPAESFSYLTYKADAFLSLYGDSWLERVALQTGKQRGIAKEVYALRPDRMKIHTDPRTGEITQYEYRIDQKRGKTWDVDPRTGQADVLHIKLFNPIDDWFGGAPTESTAREIDASNEATTWQMRTLQNGARPSMVYTVKNTLSDMQRQQMEQAIMNKFRGGMNAGKHIILEGETTVTPYGWTPTEMDFIEGKRELARSIALGYGVPPMLLGIPGDNTYSNYKEARLAFWESTVFFHINLIQHAISEWLLHDEENVVVRPDIDSVPALEPRRQEAWDKAKGADWLTLDEKRELCGYDALPSKQGEVILVPSSMIPLEQAVMPPEPAMLPEGADATDEDFLLGGEDAAGEERE